MLSCVRSVMGGVWRGLGNRVGSAVKNGVGWFCGVSSSSDGVPGNADTGGNAGYGSSKPGWSSRKALQAHNCGGGEDTPLIQQSPKNPVPDTAPRECPQHYSSCASVVRTSDPLENLKHRIVLPALIAAVVSTIEDWSVWIIGISALCPELANTSLCGLAVLGLFMSIAMGGCQYYFLSLKRDRVDQETDASKTRLALNTCLMLAKIAACVVEGFKFFYGVYVTELQSKATDTKSDLQRKLWLTFALTIGIMRSCAVNAVEGNALMYGRQLPNNIVIKSASNLLLRIKYVLNMFAFLPQSLPLIEGSIHAIAVTAFFSELAKVADTDHPMITAVMYFLAGLGFMSESGVQSFLNVPRVDDYLQKSWNDAIRDDPSLQSIGPDTKEMRMAKLIKYNGALGVVLQIAFIPIVLIHGLFQLIFNCSSVFIPSKYIMFFGKSISQSLMICKAFIVLSNSTPYVVEHYLGKTVEPIGKEIIFAVSLTLGVLCGIPIACKYLRLSVPTTQEHQHQWGSRQSSGDELYVRTMYNAVLQHLIEQCHKLWYGPRYNVLIGMPLRICTTLISSYTDIEPGTANGS